MDKIGMRIAQYRKARGLTQKELADKIGTVKQTIGNYERGDRTPTPAVVHKIAKVLDVKPVLLFGVQDASDVDSFGERLLNYMIINGDTAASLALALGTDIESIQRMTAGDLDPSPEELDIIARRYQITLAQLIRKGISGDLMKEECGYSARHKRVPLIGSVAAGQPIFADEDYSVFVETEVDCDYALRVQGDSMVPTYMNDDVIFIRKQETVNEGEVAVVLIDDEATLKHVYVRQGVGLTLYSDNPNYSAMFIDFADHDYIRILGIPVGYIRIFKRNKLAGVKKGMR